MSTPRRIRALRMWANVYPISGEIVTHASKASAENSRDEGGKTERVAVIRVSNPAALIEQVADAISQHACHFPLAKGTGLYQVACRAEARAVLTSLNLIAKARK